MTVALARLAVRRPSRVRNSAVRFEEEAGGQFAFGVARVALVHRLLEHTHLAFRLDNLDVTLRVGIVDVAQVAVDSDARRIVAAIFEPMEAIDEQLENLAAPSRRAEVDVGENAWREEKFAVGTFCAGWLN